MRTLSVREARQALSHLDRLLIGEDEVIITRHGKPVARLVRVGPRRPIPSHRDLRDSMPKMRERSEKLVREDRDVR
jgi:antitoxin (DNA-binding transcriptional repressor) of toxin-antitoxin stability system